MLREMMLLPLPSIPQYPLQMVSRNDAAGAALLVIGLFGLCNSPGVSLGNEPEHICITRRHTHTRHYITRATALPISMIVRRQSHFMSA